MVKNFVSVDNPHRLLTPGCVTLISVGDGRDKNIFPVAWTMPLRKAPPMLAILSGKSHFSYKFIKKTGEFGLNIPDKSIAKEVIKSGKISGKDVGDKFKHTGLTPISSSKIKAPLIEEAIARMECRVSQVTDMGSSAILIAQIIRVEVRSDCYNDGKWDFSQGLELIHHMGGNEFAISDHSITVQRK